MKKRFLVIMMFSLFIMSNNIEAKSQNLSKIVYNKYDGTDKELYIWGANHSGNLGIGNKKDLSETDKIKVNDLIEKQKIIDYAITDSQTYVLTENKRIYASGYGIGVGNYDKVTSVFTELKTLNNSNFKITDLNVTLNRESDSCKKALGSNDKCLTEIVFKTNNKKVFTRFFNYYYPPKTPGTVDWFENFVNYTYNYGYMNSKYPIYYDKRNTKGVIVGFSNNKGYLTNKYIINEKGRKYTKNIYEKGKMVYKRNFSDYKDTITRYKNGEKAIKYTIFYKVNKQKERSKKKEWAYNFKNGIIKTRTNYVKKNKKLSIVSKKYYYVNKKNQLKSNSNGNAKCYITYYKNKKAYVTYKYDYNKKGKMINKIEVKLKK